MLNFVIYTCLLPVPSQVIILARVIVDRDQVSLTADAITALVRILKSSDDNAVILAGASDNPSLN